MVIFMKRYSGSCLSRNVNCVLEIGSVVLFASIASGVEIEYYLEMAERGSVYSFPEETKHDLITINTCCQSSHGQLVPHFAIDLFSISYYAEI